MEDQVQQTNTGIVETEPQVQEQPKMVQMTQEQLNTLFSLIFTGSNLNDFTLLSHWVGLSLVDTACKQNISSSCIGKEVKSIEI